MNPNARSLSAVWFQRPLDDVLSWVSEEMVQKYLGGGSGIKGALSAFGFPLLIPIPTFMAFPIGNTLYNRKARLAFVCIFFEAMAFSIISLLIEVQFLGTVWVSTRLLLSIPIIMAISLLNEWLYFRLRFGSPIPKQY